MRAYLFVLEIEPMEVGRIYDSLPLHCTLMHWFRSDATPEMILEISSGVFASASPIEIVSDAAELFGKNQNIPVHTVKSDTIHSLHDKLLSVLSKITFEPTEPEFIGIGYRPHVTTHGEYSFPAGSKATAQNVYFIEALDADGIKNKIILSKIKLG